jgi:3-oxoacyl-[acyl-carrier protein] reductase
MDLGINAKKFIVCGATSGFGQAIAKQLINEGASIIAIARNEEKLKEFQDAYTKGIEILIGDITQSKTIARLKELIKGKSIHGIVVNASGPPAKSFIETSMSDWDEAYTQLVRWKIELTAAFLPIFINQGYGRFVYIESSAVKQPLENLVLSTSLRLSVVGLIKTLSQEIPDKGVTFNVLAPGYHDTPAAERLINKKAEVLKISKKEARAFLVKTIPKKEMGDVDHFASLAVWLLSPLADYVNGQVYTIDGGLVKSTL